MNKKIEDIVYDIKDLIEIIRTIPLVITLSCILLYIKIRTESKKIFKK